MYFRQIEIAFPRRVADAHPSRYRENSAGHLHIFQTHLEAIAPRQARRFASQRSVPSQRRSQRNLIVGKSRKDVCGRKRLLRQTSRQETQHRPTKQGSTGTGANRIAPGQDQGKTQQGAGQPQQHRQEKSVSFERQDEPRLAEHDAARKCCDNRDGRRLHVTLRNLTNVSI